MSSKAARETGSDNYHKKTFSVTREWGKSTTNHLPEVCLSQNIPSFSGLLFSAELMQAFWYWLISDPNTWHLKWNTKKIKISEQCFVVTHSCRAIPQQMFYLARRTRHLNLRFNQRFPGLLASLCEEPPSVPPSASSQVFVRSQMGFLLTSLCSKISWIQMWMIKDSFGGFFSLSYFTLWRSRHAAQIEIVWSFWSQCSQRRKTYGVNSGPCCCVTMALRCSTRGGSGGTWCHFQQTRWQNGCSHFGHLCQRIKIVPQLSGSVWTYHGCTATMPHRRRCMCVDHRVAPLKSTFFLSALQIGNIVSDTFLLWKRSHSFQLPLGAEKLTLSLNSWRFFFFGLHVW